MSDFETILFHDYAIVSVSGNGEISDVDSVAGDESYESYDPDDIVQFGTDDIYSDNHHWDVRMSQPTRYRYKPETWFNMQFFSEV